ncbi:MAG TPA: hypothetical protein VNI52_03430 [Sphingobacteriaceae bacterium]|nr:hypothetical protein [Sphingobacteriaceae bacterium]
MKSILNLSLLFFLFLGCTSTEKLDREKAFKVLQEEKVFPKIVDAEIYVADPEEAAKVIKSGLEQEGFLSIQKTQSLAEVGQPFITFTEKARPYLISQTSEDIKNNIQRVKIAEEQIKEVTGVKLLDGDKQALVEYKTIVNNQTPFSKLSQINVSEEKTHESKFSLYDDGWRVEKGYVK